VRWRDSTRNWVVAKLHSVSSAARVERRHMHTIIAVSRASSTKSVYPAVFVYAKFCCMLDRCKNACCCKVHRVESVHEQRVCGWCISTAALQSQYRSGSSHTACRSCDFSWSPCQCSAPSRSHSHDSTHSHWLPRRWQSPRIAVQTRHYCLAHSGRGKRGSLPRTAVPKRVCQANILHGMYTFELTG